MREQLRLRAIFSLQRLTDRACLICRHNAAVWRAKRRWDGETNRNSKGLGIPLLDYSLEDVEIVDHVVLPVLLLSVVNR